MTSTNGQVPGQVPDALYYVGAPVSPPPSIAKPSFNLPPNCPRLLDPSGLDCVIHKCHYFVECHISTAFITITAEFENSLHDGEFILNVPLFESSVVNFTQVAVGERVIETLVIPLEDAKDLARSDQKLKEKAAASSPVSTAPNAVAPVDNTARASTPDMFRLPVTKLHVSDRVHVTFTYFQPCDFVDGRYSLSIPMYIPSTLLPSPSLYMYSPSPLALLSSVLNMNVQINTGTPNCQWGSSSHQMRLISQSASRIELALENADIDVGRVDGLFEINYYIESREILTNLITEPMGSDPIDGRGSFCLFVSPPAAGSVVTVFGRNIVFLLDRSGSMGGAPFRAAKLAIQHALDKLHPRDRFTIIAFDHTQVFFSPFLVSADGHIIQSAKEFLEEIHASGGTDILQPLDSAIKILKEMPIGINFIFLLTDGSVSNEREIVKMAQSEAGPSIRISTLGMGAYCNTYFLKMLSQNGKGFSEIALSQDGIFKQISRLLSIAETPLLVDVELLIDESAKAEVYPTPQADLFCGAPLMVCGKFFGQTLPPITLRGRLPDGSRFEKQIAPQQSRFVPISRVFLKQRLDITTANAWLSNKPEDIKKAVSLSCQANMVSPYTMMVGFETTKAQQEQDKAKIEELKKTPVGRKTLVNDSLAVGGFVLLGGATLLTFGSVAATLGNLSVLDGIEKLFSGINLGFDGGGGFEFGLDQLEEAASAAIEWCPQLYDCGSSVIESIGNTCSCISCGAALAFGSSVIEGCGGVVSGCGGIVTGCGSGLVDALGSCCSQCDWSGLSSCVSDLLRSI